MKAGKIREQSAGELEAKLKETDEQLFHLKMKMKTGQLEGLKKYRELRKDKARMLTVRRERELAAGK